MARRRFSASTVRSVGSLLPPDVLAKASAGEGLEGLEVDDFGFEPDERLRDVVTDAWNEARGLWWQYQSQLRDLDETDATATALTRERWLLPLLELLGFEAPDVARSAISVGDVEYPISHTWESSPLHLMGARVGLDERAGGIAGAARLSPHSLIQQFLNRSDDHLWGIVSNGDRLRILRDSVSLTRQAYVEFDLEAMFNGEVFADFALLYKTAHATRFSGDRPEDCLLERWIAAARDEGIRALDQLRDGVESALTAFGTGFLRHPSNGAVRDSVDAGSLDERDLYRYLLRLVYRLLFLFVAEDRDLLLVPEASAEVRERYDRFYSTGRLRELAERPVGSGHSDLGKGLAALFDVLGRDEGEPELGLPGLGSFLWADDAIGPLIAASLDNEVLLRAIRGLSYVQVDGTARRIDFAGMGAEELGSVYESLLELHPSIDREDRSFRLGAGAGSERKTTGSYYTPTELISELLDSALDPVVNRAIASEDPEAAILDLKVVDPAAGSGHFLVAAAHRIGKRLAEVRTGEPEPPNDAYRTAVRDVVSRCLFAVDINDLAVELCKVSLWLEALEPGKPLSFLDHHILVGNSLFGANPAAIAGGIPDDAFVVVTGDDKSTATALKKRSKRERAGQRGLFESPTASLVLAGEIEALERFDDSDVESVRTKERLLSDWKSSEAYRHAWLVADTWCAAFGIRKTADVPGITESTFRDLRDSNRMSAALRRSVEEVQYEYEFFHWHLAFPQVFAADENVVDGERVRGGFDVVLGNPPWERVKLQEKEFFAAVAPEISSAPTKAARSRLIDNLKKQRPSLWHAFRGALRQAEVTSNYLRKSALYPLCGRGDVNTYAVFAELMRRILDPLGRVGVVVPTGIATDDTTKYFFGDVVEAQSLVSLFGFYDRGRMFRGADVHGFCLLTMSGDDSLCEKPEFVFFARSVAEMRDPQRRFTLTSDDFRLLNPNTRTCPIFRSRKDAELTKDIYRRIPVLINRTQPDGNPWGVRLQAMFHMSNDSHLFRTEAELRAEGWRPRNGVFERTDKQFVPLYEGKIIHYFDHRHATFVESGFVDVPEETKESLRFEPSFRYHVPISAMNDRLGADSSTELLAGFRNIGRSTDSRSLIIAAFPRLAAGNNLPLLVAKDESDTTSLVAILSSFVVDFCVRQKLGGTTLNFFIVEQFPVLGPELLRGPSPWDPRSTVAHWIATRSHELTFTSAGFRTPRTGVCYRYDPVRRSVLLAELDAALLHLYGIGHDDADYILETFPVVKMRDVAEHGTYRTKDLILDAHRRLAIAIDTGEPFRTTLDPPPADPTLRVNVGAFG